MKLVYRNTSIKPTETIFKESTTHYENHLRQPGYNKKLTYKPTNTKHQKHSKHKRKIIWFNPPFSKNVSTKIGKSFLNLLDLHFPRNHIYSSIFNRNKIKVSYSCMQNIKSVINNHNMKVLNNTTETEESCNCRNGNNVPLDGNCLTPSIIYEGHVTSNQLNYKQKVYIGIAETNFKHRFSNHIKSFNLEHYENGTELSKEYWSIKRNHFTPKFISRIISTFQYNQKKNVICVSMMIARTKSYVFTVIFPAVFPLEPTFWPAQFMFCIYGFQNRNWPAQSNGFIGEYCAEHLLWKQHENGTTFSFGYYYTVPFSLYVISFDGRLP